MPYNIYLEFYVNKFEKTFKISAQHVFQRQNYKKYSKTKQKTRIIH